MISPIIGNRLITIANTTITPDDKSEEEFTLKQGGESRIIDVIFTPNVKSSSGVVLLLESDYMRNFMIDANDPHFIDVCPLNDSDIEQLVKQQEL